MYPPRPRARPVSSDFRLVPLLPHLSSLTGQPPIVKPNFNKEVRTSVADRSVEVQVLSLRRKLGKLG